MRANRCENCAARLPYKPTDNKPVTGECHRRPPSVEKPIDIVVTLWPKTAHDNWCLCHVPKEAKS